MSCESPERPLTQTISSPTITLQLPQKQQRSRMPLGLTVKHSGANGQVSTRQIAHFVNPARTMNMQLPNPSDCNSTPLHLGFGPGNVPNVEQSVLRHA